MAFWDSWFKNESNDVLDEALQPFAGKQSSKEKKIEDLKRRHGEGIEDFSQVASGFGIFGSSDVKLFNSFYKKFIDFSYKNELDKMYDYRMIARYPEIAEVLEDIIYESTQKDVDGNVINLEIVDDDLLNNENIVKNIYDEFEKLFYKRIDIAKKIDDLLYSYYVDGRVYWENIIDIKKPKNGILNIKKLPSETMDFSWNPITGKYNFFVQYLKKIGKLPATLEAIEKNQEEMIGFYPKQITYLDYGQYGQGGKKEIFGYLEKAKQPYNQLKLLETSVVIYRLVRAPERLVFRIDVGNMPRDKAMKYVEKVKQNLQKKVSYDPTTGKTNNEPNVLSMLENFFLPQTSSGRGSNIESIGGNPSGFAELDDLHYFQRKLYRALKYPMSRVESMHEKQSKDILFGGQGGEIARDETKWGRFLKKHQDKFADAFLDIFIMHLDFIGLATQYGIDRSKLNIKMTVPNNYISQMRQIEFTQRWDNYGITEKDEFSKYWRMKKFLQLTDEEIQENAKGFIKDKELGLTKGDDEGGGYGY